MSGDDVFPDRDMAHADKIAWMVETQGWALEVVPARPAADPPDPPYAYSVGLTSTFGFPEVVVYGLTPVAARGLVGEVVGLLRDGTVPPVGPLFLGLFDNDLRSALLPVDLDVWSDLFGSARAWHGPEPFAVVQLVWPDRNGWMPWESGFDQRIAHAQPVIGALDDV